VEGKWDLKCNEESEVFSYDTLRDGKLTMVENNGTALEIPLPSVLSLTGRFESTNPLDRPLRGPRGPKIDSVDIDGVAKSIFFDNSENVIVILAKSLGSPK
jgi:hypothetical protein